MFPKYKERSKKKNVLRYYPHKTRHTPTPIAMAVALVPFFLSFGLPSELVYAHSPAAHSKEDLHQAALGLLQLNQPSETLTVDSVRAHSRRGQYLWLHVSFKGHRGYTWLPFEDAIANEVIRSYAAKAGLHLPPE